MDSCAFLACFLVAMSGWLEGSLSVCSSSPEPMKILLPILSTALYLSNAVVAQQTAYHTFTPPPSGSDIVWPASIPDFGYLEPGDEISPGVYYEGLIVIDNDINNTIFFDNHYLATGNAPNISGNAMWGNPRTGSPLEDPYLNLEFDDFFSQDENDNLVDKVTSISFDFAWASTNPNANLGTLVIQVDDYANWDYDFVYVNLDQNFTHSIGGNGQGWSGHVVLTVGDNVDLDNIGQIFIQNLDDSNPGGFVGEFAIDNIRVNGVGNNLSEVYPVDSNGPSSSAYSTNSLKNQGIFSIADNVFNGGGDSTTFTVLWSGSDPLIYQPQAYVGHPIAVGETVHGAVTWAINTDTAPSGTYSGEFTIKNDENPTDPDDTIELLEYKLYDPPVLSSNAGTTLVAPGGQTSISNGPVASHNGALRASLKVTEMLLSNSRFEVTGMAPAEVADYQVQNPAESIVNPGNSLHGNIGFNSPGAAAGTHTGTLRVKLEMTTATRNYLNSKKPVPDQVWSLSYTVPAKPTATPAVTTGQNLADAGADISGPETGAAIVGGTSSSDQTVSLGFNDNPPVSNPSGYGSAIDLGFSGTQNLYVLQLSYENLPAGYSTQDLRIQAFDASSWVPAISLNGNGGTAVTGAQPYLGSYAGYLSELGGDTLDAADLGAFGVDTASKTVWIVLDYGGTFQVVTGAFTAPFKILGITYDAGTNTATLSYQSQPGVTHSVLGGLSPGALVPIGTTDAGTGAIMDFAHHPAGAPSRFFYKMSEPSK